MKESGKRAAANYVSVPIPLQRWGRGMRNGLLSGMLRNSGKGPIENAEEAGLGKSKMIYEDLQKNQSGTFDLVDPYAIERRSGKPDGALEGTNAEISAVKIRGNGYRWMISKYYLYILGERGYNGKNM